MAHADELPAKLCSAVVAMRHGAIRSLVVLSMVMLCHVIATSANNYAVEVVAHPVTGKNGPALIAAINGDNPVKP